MAKRTFAFSILCSSLLSLSLFSHCQMPCGVYHDDMVYDQIDQYVETMVKGDTILSENKFETVFDKNEFIRWVLTKDKLSDQIAQLITTYFLQQKIKPGEESTGKRVESAHKLLFLLVSIKQTADVKVVKQFYDEWEKFKLMFHIEGYSCFMEQKKLKEQEEKEEEENKGSDNSASGIKEKNHDHWHSHHDHDHDHSHVH